MPGYGSPSSNSIEVANPALQGLSARMKASAIPKTC